MREVLFAVFPVKGGLYERNLHKNKCNELYYIINPDAKLELSKLTVVM